MGNGFPEDCTKCEFYHTCINACYGSKACKFEREITEMALNRFKTQNEAALNKK